MRSLTENVLWACKINYNTRTNKCKQAKISIRFYAEIEYIVPIIAAIKTHGQKNNTFTEPILL